MIFCCGGCGGADMGGVRGVNTEDDDALTYGSVPWFINADEAFLFLRVNCGVDACTIAAALVVIEALL